MTLQERLQNFSSDTHNLKIDYENKISEINIIKNKISDHQKQIEEEKSKNRNLVNLIEQLEKKKSSTKLENECNYFREQVKILSSKIQDIEGKYKKKLEKKDMIIKLYMSN